MLDEKYISVLLDYNSMEIHSSFLKSSSLSANFTGKKDITQHNDFEILIGLEGYYSYFFNDQCYGCKAGSVFLISPQEKHESYYTTNSNSLVHMWMRLYSDFLLVDISNIKDGKIKNLFHSKITYNNYLPKLKIFDLWNYLLNKRKISSRNLVDLKLALSHLFLAVIEAKPLSINEYREEIMLRAANYIKKHFHEKINLDQLAAQMGYSKFHFIRQFKRYHTVTVQEYIDQHRLKEVKLLLDNKATHKEIALHLGFSSRSSFANWYAKYR